MKMLEQIRKKFNAGEYRITRHCQRRCDNRNISLQEIKEVINKGEIIEIYPKDSPYPSCLILGYVHHN